MLTLEESVKLLMDGFAETDRKIAKTNRVLAKRLAKSRAETEAMLAESRAKTEEILAKTKEIRAETEARLAKEMLEYKEENRIGFEELRKSQKKTEDFFNTQWGKLVEALVNNQVIPLLQDRGIAVDQTIQRSSNQKSSNELT